MQSLQSRPIQVLAALALCVAASGCRTMYAYRARVVGDPVQLRPASPLVPTPAPAIPHAAAAVPQPAIPSPLPRAAHQPPSAPSLISSGVVLEKVGPAQATLGALVTYRIEVQAASGGARDVTVSDQLAQGLRYESSTPPAALAGTHLEWRLGDLRGGERRTIEVHFRAEQAGVFNNCAVARSSDGQTSQDCASTAVVIPELEVRVGIAGSDTVMVGERVTFEVTVTNRGNVPATGLVITDHFDRGLEHEAAASPIEKELGQLAGGQSQTIGVTFRATQPGRLCNRVEVRGEAGVRGAGQACVTAVSAAPPAGQPPAQGVPGPPQTAIPPVQPPPAQSSPPQRAELEVKVSGPAAPQSIDSVAEFVIHITNTGERALTNLTVTSSSDANLLPVQATDGYEWDDRDNLVWKIPALATGKSTRLQLNTRCRSTAPKACIRVRVASQEGAAAEGENCLEIRRGQTQLSMTVDGLDNPVTVGRDLTYEVRIKNTGSVADRNVALTVIVPAEMSVIRLGTVGDRTTYEIEGQNVRFKPVAELTPGETLKFRVRARAVQAGDVKLEAVFNSEGQPQPTTVTEETTVLQRGE
jgi:uncharacterized repeat protein (TIGR01451 family)